MGASYIEGYATDGCEVCPFCESKEIVYIFALSGYKCLACARGFAVVELDID